MAAEILVEFVPDFTKLENATDELVSKGVITKEFADAFKGAQKPIDDMAKRTTVATKSVQRDLGNMAKSAQGITKSFAQGFKEGVEQTLKEAGVSVKQFNDALNKSVGTQDSLKTKLREITQQLALMKAEGRDNTAQYEQLVQEAGKYRDALGDVSAEINRVASDTRKIDTAIEVFQGLAGAYQIAMAGLTLLGEDTEDYQEQLVRLNAVMAISMGLQQVGNLLQKESNVIRAITNTQMKLSVVVTNLETAATSRNVIVKGLATVAMKALNFVMSLNPALLLVTAFGLLAAALTFFSGKAKAAKEEVERLNKAMFDVTNATDDQLDRIRRTGEVVQAELDKAGAKGSEKTKQRIQELTRERAAAVIGISELQEEIGETDKKIRDGEIKNTKAVREARQKLVDQQHEYKKVANAASHSIRIAEINLQKDIIDEQKEAAEESEKNAKDRLEREKHLRKQGFEDFKARVELQLLEVEKGGLEELELKKKLLNAELQLTLDNDDLTFNQRKLLIQQFFKARKQLDDDYYKGQVKQSLENQMSIIQAELDALNVTASRREELTIGLLNRQRELELALVVNNKAKEAEINAKFDKQIADTRLAIRQESLDKELLTQDALFGEARRRLQSIADSDKSTLEQRISAIDALTQKELDSINQRKTALEKNFADGLVSQVDYNLQAAQLKDAEIAAHESAEKKKTDITKAEQQQRLETFKREVEKVLEIASAIVNTLSAINQTITDNENLRIQSMRDNLENMRETNRITQKEFEQRNKQIDRAERELKIKQARREKEIALFQAFIQGASAIVEAAPNPFLIALTTALVAAQIAAIASRQLPKFGKGTKRAPKGFAEVGETGTEIIQTDKGYYLAEHPQVIWLKGGERIYNPHETETIMKSSVPAADHSLMNGSSSYGGGQYIDYGKMAKALGNEIASHPRNVINLDEDGFTHHQQSRLNKTKYLNKRYTFHD